MPVPQRLISSAMGTGGLDFLIAYALLILCHSLFEIVIEEIDKGCEITALLIFTVHAVVDSNIANIHIWEGDLCVETYFEVVSAQSAHILHNYSADPSGIHFCHHPLKIRAVKSRTAVPVIYEKGCVLETVIISIFLQY